MARHWSENRLNGENQGLAEACAVAARELPELERRNDLREIGRQLARLICGASVVAAKDSVENWNSLEETDKPRHVADIVQLVALCDGDLSRTSFAPETPKAVFGVAQEIGVEEMDKAIGEGLSPINRPPSAKKEGTPAPLERAQKMATEAFKTLKEMQVDQSMIARIQLPGINRETFNAALGLSSPKAEHTTQFLRKEDIAKIKDGGQGGLER